jgi:hypothetical protein
MIELKHLKRLFKSVCADKKHYNDALKGINVTENKVTACNSYIMYELTGPVHSHLIDKVVKPDSPAIANDAVYIMAGNPDTVSQFWSFETACTYPKTDNVKPDESAYKSVMFTKKQLENLLNAFNAEKVVIKFHPKHPEFPVVITAENEYGLIMPCKLK